MSAATPSRDDFCSNALKSEPGWCAAHAIADFLQDRDPVHDLANIAAKTYPRFVCKRGLRWLADLPPPNCLYDMLLGTAPRVAWQAPSIFIAGRRR